MNTPASLPSFQSRVVPVVVVTDPAQAVPMAEALLAGGVDVIEITLRSAAGLIKQYAWAFPAFKRPPGVTNPMEIDTRQLSAEENAAILDFAFQRYFEESGLFGTVEDALQRVEALKRIGVTEVACLVDYGIAPEKVLEGLYPLAEVVKRARLYAHHRIGREELSVREHMSLILKRLQGARFVEFADLFDPTRGLPVVVVHFLALLELARQARQLDLDADQVIDALRPLIDEKRNQQ